jgi:hypothetical protein
LQQPVQVIPVSRRTAAIDLTVVLVFFLVCNAAEPALDPILRRGQGLTGVLALGTYQFILEGLAVLVIMAIRHERFSQYGFTVCNLGKSLVLALMLAAIYDLALSWHAGALQWVPLGRQPAVRMSLAAGFPLSILGVAVTVVVWGFFEGFFGVFFARKLNKAVGSNDRGWLSPGALVFGLFNGIIHLAIGQGIQGFVFSFASGYAIAVIPAVTGNAWGGTLVQTLTNAVGKL